jgi:hypothetical protein
LYVVSITRGREIEGRGGKHGSRLGGKYRAITWASSIGEVHDWNVTSNLATLATFLGLPFPSSFLPALSLPYPNAIVVVSILSF